MIARYRRSATFLLACAMPGMASAADCSRDGATGLTVGAVASVPAGAPRAFAVDLAAGEGIIIDLSSLLPIPQTDGESADSADTPPVRALRLCDADGLLLSPLPGEVFAKGGSVIATPDGERLRYLAAHAGTYLVNVAPADTTREILVRRREAGVAQPPVVTARLDSTQSGTVSSAQPAIFAFTAPAGQWVQLKAVSEKDTLLRLAGPDGKGTYRVMAENDDSEGLNPAIRRRLAVAGTYYVQVDSLAADSGPFELTLAKTPAPPPPAPPVPLRPGATVSGKLADGDDVRLYALPVQAGRNYIVELTAPYDGVVAIGVPDPVEPEDGDTGGAGAGFAEVRSRDSNVTGTERLHFTARTSGTLLVRVKSFGIGDSGGDYVLKALDADS